MSKKIQPQVELKSVKEIIEDIKSEEIILKLIIDGKDVSRDYNWEEEKAEQFIKSMMVKTNCKVQPLHFIDRGITFEELNDPNFDMDEIDEDEKYQIETLDGKQRLKALLDFSEDKVKLNGKYFSEQPEEIQNEFMDFVFALYICPCRDNKRIAELFAHTSLIK